MSHCRRLTCLLFVLFTFTLAPFAHAQIDTGVIVGRVTDDSGAVLPGVTVVATQDGTGLASTTVTNDRGEFIFPGLRVGAYAVTAELQGFRRAVRRDIRVNVQTRAQVDLQMSVGAPGRGSDRHPARCGRHEGITRHHVAG